MITLFCFRIIYPCRIEVVNIGIRGVDREMSAKLVYVSRKISVFIDLLLVCSLIRTLIVKLVRQMTYFAWSFIHTTELW
jgi:hypothetical protein